LVAGVGNDPTPNLAYETNVCHQNPQLFFTYSLDLHNVGH
jgi:hypothetical protein